MPLAGFEPATPATKRPQTYALDRTATGIGIEPSHDVIIVALSSTCDQSDKAVVVHVNGVGVTLCL
jgi:hypothetical protein